MRKGLLLAVLLSVPAVAKAQTPVADTSLSDAPPPIPAFQISAPQPQRNNDGIGLVRGNNWWEFPATPIDLPRWKISQSVAFKTAGGVSLGATFSGRRGDPLPLFLSEGTPPTLTGTLALGPGSFRTQWDTKFSISVPLWSGARVKVNAIGDLLVPLTRPPSEPDSMTSLLAARTIRFGILTTF
jgi:hypothetical protein